MPTGPGRRQLLEPAPKRAVEAHSPPASVPAARASIDAASGPRHARAPRRPSPTWARGPVRARAHACRSPPTALESRTSAGFRFEPVRPLAEARESVRASGRRLSGTTDLLRLEDRRRHLPRLVQVARPSERAGEVDGRAGLRGELVVGELRDRLDRQPADPPQVVANVAAGEVERIEVGADRLGGDAVVPKPAQRGPGARFELAAVLAKNEAVMDVLGRVRPEGLGQPTVQRLVRAVIDPAYDVRDAEVDVVDGARELVGRGPVARRSVTPSRRSAPSASRRAGTDSAASGGAPPLAPDAPGPRPSRPRASEGPRRSPAGAGRDVPGRVRVVDPQKHPIAEPPVRDSRECVADVERSRRARRERTRAAMPPLIAGSAPSAVSASAGACSSPSTGRPGRAEERRDQSGSRAIAARSLRPSSTARMTALDQPRSRTSSSAASSGLIVGRPNGSASWTARPSPRFESVTPTSVQPCASYSGMAAASRPRAAARIVPVSAVASASVYDRVARVKSSKRSAA